MATPEEEAAAAAAAKAAKVKTIEVRVLRHHEEHSPNDVIALSEAEAKSACAEGDHRWADADPDAVAYAKTLSA